MGLPLITPAEKKRKQNKNNGVTMGPPLIASSC